MSLTDEIYQKLNDGLETGLDWQHFLAEYGADKPALYNALGRVLTGILAKIAALNDKRKQAQQDLDEAGRKLGSLGQKISEADEDIQAKNQEIVTLQGKKEELRKQTKTLESDLEQKGKPLEQLRELEESGFSEERLRALHTALVDMGAKRGLKRDEAVNAFFTQLKNYDALLGFAQELKRLDSIITTKSLEAEKWQAEADSLARHYKDLNEAIAALKDLMKQGVKPEQIISWNDSLTSLGGVKELERGLGHYKSAQGLLAAKRRETKKLDTKMTKLNGEVNTLRQQKVEITGSIKALRASAVAEIERLGRTGIETVKAQKGQMEDSIKKLKASALEDIREVGQTGLGGIGKLAEAGSDSIRATGETALSELRETLSLIDELGNRALEVGKMLGQIEDRLSKSKELKEETEALISGIEGGR